MTSKYKYTKSESHPEGGCWGWLSVVGLFIRLFFAKGTSVALGIFFITFIEYFNESAAKTSWILSLSSGLTWMVSPITAACAKKFGFRKVAMVGAAISFLSLTISTFSTKLWHLIVTFGFFNGLAYGTLSPPVIANVALYFKRRHPLASGIGFMGTGVGTLALPTIFQFCIDAYGWRGAILVFAGMSANLFISAALIVSIKRPKPKRTNTIDNLDFEVLDGQTPIIEGETGGTSEDEVGFKNSKSRSTTCRACCLDCKTCSTFFDFRLLTSNRMYVLLVSCQAIFSVGQAISLVHLAPIVLSIVKSKSTTARLLSINGVGLLVGSPTFGFILSRFRVNRILYTSLINLLNGVSVLLLPFTSSLGAAIPLLFAIGMSRSGYAAQFNVTVRSILPDASFITGLGWGLLLSSFGQLIGPIISGHLRDITGSYDCSFYFAGATMGVSGLILAAGHYMLRSKTDSPVLDLSVRPPEPLAITEYMSSV
ncbi:monocarboxylate transporter 12-like [Glandiceps talaboti]